MSTPVRILVSVGLSYLLGSVPSAYIAARIMGQRDPRQVGSRNVGGMNVLRNIGLAPGLLTIALDVGKGFAAAAISARLAGPSWCWAALPVAVAAHNWMPWLGFHGGKGIAVTTGVLAALNVVAAVAFLMVLVLLVAVLRESDPASLLAFAFLTTVLWASGAGTAATLATVMAFLIHLARVAPELVNRPPR